MTRVTAELSILCSYSVDLKSDGPFTEQEAKFAASALQKQIDAYRERQRFARAVQDILNKETPGRKDVSVSVEPQKGAIP